MLLQKGKFVEDKMKKNHLALVLVIAIAVRMLQSNEKRKTTCHGLGEKKGDGDLLSFLIQPVHHANELKNMEGWENESSYLPFTTWHM